MKYRNAFLSSVICLCSFAAMAAAQGNISVPPLGGDQRAKWFDDAKFGMFIHWGPYAVLGRHEWSRHRFEIPQAEYDKYARAFNPVHYDPDAWVDLARQAGAKYIVITSKHHDGFSIYRSQASDYDMEITPYEGDPLKMLADACRRKGMRLGFYHSIMDWHHPDYRPRRAWEYKDPNKGGDNLRYIQYMESQIRELLTNYGDVAVMWFDGEWEHTLRDNNKEMEIYDLIRGLQPNTLINDRLFERNPASPADLATPEQFVPATGVLGPGGKPIRWESCVTINNDSWGYNKYETEFKTSRDLIRMLIEVVSKGGNLLLNIGPMPDGRIQDEFVTRLKAIGAWMDVNGEAIYGTTASPFARLPFFGRATVKDNKLYLHVFEWPASGKLLVPGLKNLVSSAYLLAQPGEKLTVTRENQNVLISLPTAAPDGVASVVVLTLDGAPFTESFVIGPDKDGILNLGAESSEIQTRFGQRAKKENALGHVFITQWSRADDVPTWTIDVPEAGRYNVTLHYGAGQGSADIPYKLIAGDSVLSGKVAPTGNAWVFKPHKLGAINLKAGEQTIQVQAETKGVPAMSLEKLILEPLE